MIADDRLDTLPPTWRLALAYAPAAARPFWLSLLALDVRLAGVVRQAREPMLGQMKLAWWRDRLGGDPEGWPKGEPLLSSLRAWGDQAGGLIPLVDGWETLLGEWEDGAGPAEALTQGRIAAVEALARVLGLAPGAGVAAMARGWAAMDLASHLGDPGERADAMARLADLDWRRHRLPRGLRPLIVLHGLARRERQGGDPSSPMALAHAIRLGIFGA
jgi:15-cis-phytoene synthase